MAAPSIGAWAQPRRLLADSPPAELRRADPTLDNRHDEVVASMTVRATNAATESLGPPAQTRRPDLSHSESPPVVHRTNTSPGDYPTPSKSARLRRSGLPLR